MESARSYLIEILNDWRNNYLTFATFADHNGLTLSEATELLNLARKVATHPHPES